MRFVGVGNEPSDMGLIVGASSRLSGGKFIATRIEAALTCAVEYSGKHSFPQFRKQWSDIQFALDARFECRGILSGHSKLRVLQIVKGAAIGERRRKRSKLERRDLDAFAETGHARHTALLRGRHGKRAGLLVIQIVTGEFSESEKAAVLRNRFKTHTLAELFKKRIV